VNSFLESLHSSKADIRCALVSQGLRPICTYFAKPEYSTALFPLYSITKSISSLAFGFAIAEKDAPLLRSPIISFCKNELPSQYDSRLASLTFHHILCQCSGLKWREMGIAWGHGNPLWEMEQSRDWIAYVLGHEFSTEPGRHFNYSTGASHLLPYLLGKITQANPSQIINERLFAPLGINEYKWDVDPMGNLAGGKGLALKAQDLLHIGELVLQKGKWGAHQIVDGAWINESTRIHTKGTAFYGDYGYQWWIRPEGVIAALGFGGQALMIDPRSELVAVFLGNLGKQDFFLPMELFKTLQVGIDETPSLV